MRGQSFVLSILYLPLKLYVMAKTAAFARMKLNDITMQLSFCSRVFVCYFQDYRLHWFRTDRAVIAHFLICQEVLANGGWAFQQS